MAKTSPGSFKDFTNLYELQKTLRFELKPVEETLENMKKHLEYDPNLQTFMKDQNIEDSYQILKPALDKIHEEFINQSLTSKEAKEINFLEYIDVYKNRKENLNDLIETEKRLRGQISKTYLEGGLWLKKKYPGLKWKNGSNDAKGSAMLSCQAVLEVIKQEYSKDKKIQNAIKTFEGFFTYFSGFNQNRKNYYETEAKATAVATRIVNENLPKFCDNTTFFGSRQEEYENCYQFLKKSEKNLVNKDGEELHKISDKIFDIDRFKDYLSQKGIESYNIEIANANSLINLYNQSRDKEKGFKKLPHFKTLYKQIGCGKRDSLFFSLKYDWERELTEEERKAEKEIFSVEKTLKSASELGEKYFEEDAAKKNEVETIFDFTNRLRNREDWKGFYWSKQAVNTISNKYFANWHDIKDCLKDNKACVSFDKKREEQIKINDAVELAGLFEALDGINLETGWSKSFFKKSILEDKKRLIDENISPSKNLINLLCADIEENATAFRGKSAEILELKEYKSEERKKQIKEWMDYALAVNRMVKYFVVKENKTKGAPIDSELATVLDNLLRTDGIDWFKWYDALRNYLTKKPQDDVKENKLKLNFNKGNLLNGFVDSHTESSDNATQYGGYLFRKKYLETDRYEYFLGISEDSKLFRCHLKDCIQKENACEFERLEYYQAKSTTFFSAQYSINKDKIVKLLSVKIKEKVESRKKTVSEKNDLNKIDDLGKKLLRGETPTKMIYSINKEREFIDILEDSDLNILIIQTIKEIKEHIEKYTSRNSKLKIIQERNYTSHEGLKSIIEDLQNIAKEQKEYNYFSVSRKEFKEACARDKKSLYIFKISNKDLETCTREANNSNGKISAKNLHTMYFECLFAGNQDTIDIGKGTIFYRKKALKAKEIKKGYEKKPWVISSKRFTENEELEKGKEKSFTDGKSFFFHLSTTINYKSKSYSKPEYAINEINAHVNKNLSKDSVLRFLGLDRGEKHLVYYSLVDGNGNIEDQGTLNLPFKDKEGNIRCLKKDKYSYDKQKKEWEKKEVDCWNYNDLLDAAMSNRDMARKNWQTIGNIKNLKEGYISQVVHEIVEIVTGKPTFIVLEDLNTEFKRGRQKIEKQVYQKFELALAKKLNYVVDKTKKNGEVGSVTNALQLTPPVANYGDIENKKQMGVMLYTRANYTSQTDPATGWRKTIYLRGGSEEEIQKQIKEQFIDIGVDGRDYYFEYQDKSTNKIWKLWSGKSGESLLRYRGKRGEDKNIWEIQTVNIKEILDKLFANFETNKSLMSQIFAEGKRLSKDDDKHTAWESLRFAIDMIQQIRNSGDTSKEQDDNFLLSPVRDERGNHFDSRKVSKEEGLPIDADANGAYNIARKGIIMNAHIRQWGKDGSKKNKNGSDLDLFISDYEWDLWLNDKNGWQEKLPMFASRAKMEEFRKNQKL